MGEDQDQEDIVCSRTNSDWTRIGLQLACMRSLVPTCKISNALVGRC